MVNHCAVLFDLDGTLVDTAPDMVAVLQDMQRERGIDPIQYSLGRAHVSNGALGLLRVAFPEADEEARQALLLDYIGRYSLRICRDSSLFSDLDKLLLDLEAARMPWGIVTNKPRKLTLPLLEHLALSKRMACAVSGDTLPQKKPDPAPLLHACKVARVLPEQTLYIGDAKRDIEAGQRAGMLTIAAAYGYIVPGDDPESWGADAVAGAPMELTQIVRHAVNLPFD